ncbi:MAG: DDE-type integrase/transposase/recombinase [Desulfobulbus sp.]|nr:DDE-type integrase/transposase/recombinase [Desulfobulbus sp.]
MTDKRKPEETAVTRLRIITPLLVAMEEHADAAKIVQLRKELCQQNGISRRTLGRWLDAHLAYGFEGLKPMPRSNQFGAAISEEVIQEAILLRREVPSRSMAQIIEILEMEGKVEAGVLKRSTLQDKLTERGYSSRQMKLYQQPGIAARRFTRLERNDMWHSDIKFGPFLTVNGHKKQIYLVSFLDDATRYVVHGEFYASLDQTVVEDCFRKAVMKEGLPQRVYFDNGKQYRTKWMERACAMLEIKLLYARPYSPESTGKIERFNRTVDSFLDEVALKNTKTLEDFNRLFNVWLQECYHARNHAGLDTTPEICYKSSKAPLRFLPSDVIASAFLHCETRKVDKSGCISFSGRMYEVGVLFAGQTVDVVYDPADIETLTIEHERSGEKFQVRELTIGVHTGPRPRLPKAMTRAIPETSRLLDEKEKRFQDRQEVVRRAIRFKDITGKDGENDV